MISKQVVKEFLNQELDDWSWIKKATEEELLTELKLISPNFKFKIKPRLCQLACLLLGYWNKDFNFWLDMGVGKSKVILDIISLQRSLGKKDKVLILAFNVTSVGSWIDQIKEHSDLSYSKLIGTWDDRLTALEEDKDIYLLNYAGLYSLLTKRAFVSIKNLKKDDPIIIKLKEGGSYCGVIVKITKLDISLDLGSGDLQVVKQEDIKGVLKNTKLKYDSKKVKEFSSLFNTIVFDEIHTSGCRNRKSLTWKICSKISSAMEHSYGLTGTPLGRDPMDLWPQFYLVDKGETLGEVIEVYQQAYFSASYGYFGGVEYTFKSKLESALHKRLRHKSIRYTEDELFDLPQVVRTEVKLTFTVEVYEYYTRALEGFTESLKGDYKTLENAFTKLRQLTAGFLYFKHEEKGRVSIDFEDNPKLGALEEIISGLPESEKIIVFHEFIESGHLIEKQLKKLSINYVRLYKDKEDARIKFIKDPNCKVFLANSQSGGTALDGLQVAKYGVFYESPVSPIIRKQAEKRFTGARQLKHRSFIYDLVIKNSIDERVLEFLKEGKDIFEALVEGKIKL